MLRFQGSSASSWRPRLSYSHTSIKQNSLLHLTRLYGTSTEPELIHENNTNNNSDSSTTTVDTSASSAPFVWRQTLSKEQLLKIDYVMYCFNKYKTTPDAHTTPSATKSEASISTSNTKEREKEVKSSSKPISKRKKRQDVLQSLSKQHQIQRPPASTPLSLNTKKGSKATARTVTPTLKEGRNRFTGDVAPDQIHPFHSLADILAYEKQLLAEGSHLEAMEEAQQKRGEEKKHAVNVRLLAHPYDLFENEALVFERFGMHTAGAEVLNTEAERKETEGKEKVDWSQKGFHGLFRQRWQDFCVTEIEVHLEDDLLAQPKGSAAAATTKASATRKKTPSPVPLYKRHNPTTMCSDEVHLAGAACVPRTYDYTVPDLPDYFYHVGRAAAAAASAGDNKKKATTVSELADEEDEGEERENATEETPDASFFEVDTSDRVKEMLTEVKTDLLRYQKKTKLTTTVPTIAAAATVATPATTITTTTTSEDSAEESPTRIQQLLASLESLEAQEAQLRSIAEDQPDITSEGLRRLLSPDAADPEATSAHADAVNTHVKRKDYYLQCTLHKQHVAHGTALSLLSQTLRIHPSDISFAGIKDFLGDTVQRVRLKNVSPQAALEANRQLGQKVHFDHDPHHHAASTSSAGAGSDTAQGGEAGADDSFSATAPKRKKLYGHVSVSDFRYETAPLFPGDLYGNFFDVVLRDVTAPVAHVEERIAAFVRDGFPNYYGCQRFSWFGGSEDASVALLHHNFLVFAFRFLNFTSEEFSLRELLQRPWLYPHPVQDAYRRHVVRRLRRLGIEPTDLDVHPFLSCPSLYEPLTNQSADTPNMRPLNIKQQLVVWQLQEAYFDLEPQSRRLTAQRQSSYLWNQVLTLRNHHFSTVGGGEVLAGDLVLPAAWRRLQGRSVQDRQQIDLNGLLLWTSAASSTSTSSSSSSGKEDKKGWDALPPPQVLSSNCILATEENRHLFTIEDVVHPGFSFGDHALPHNIVGQYYRQVCDKYHLSWDMQQQQDGADRGGGAEPQARDRQGRVLKEFYEPPRPIRRFPQQLTYHYNTSAHTLQLHFALERGCYANVAITELLRLQQCAGSEVVRLLPVPGGAAAWRSLHGGVDRGYVESVQDIYKDFEDGVGFVGGRRSEEDDGGVPWAAESEPSLLPQADAAAEDDEDNHHHALVDERRLFHDAKQDPVRRAYQWGRTHLKSNMERREVERDLYTRALFEPALARQMGEEELASYAGDFPVPIAPHMLKSKRVFFKLLKRKRKYAGGRNLIQSNTATNHSGNQSSSERAPQQQQQQRRPHHQQQTLHPSALPKLRRGAVIKNKKSAYYYNNSKRRNQQPLPVFSSLNKNTWNVTW